MNPKSRQKCFLICNAHLDPVWLWHWEDGMTEAISTYRVAADFCEEYPDFVFNHNESLLYEWVERNDAPLFRRIQRLVRAGRWHIAGGSYLQPDLIGSPGESVIRQFLFGKLYFIEKFGKEPTTAYNFDSFGHPPGMIQILAGCGFDSYIFCRPDPSQQELPIGTFRWRHTSGAEIFARRSDFHYATNRMLGYEMRRGKWWDHYKSEGDFMFLWGIGNHGGGPSREEYAEIDKLRAEFPNVELVESTPEAFFRHTFKVRNSRSFPVVTRELGPVFEGCYTSLARLKRRHRDLENMIYLTERLAALAWWKRKHPYPGADLLVAWKDVLFSEFHDILPGSAVPRVEEDSLKLLGHAEEILRRKKAEVLISLYRDESRAERNATPIFVYNPHSWEVEQEVEIEYTMDHQSDPGTVVRKLHREGKAVEMQVERPDNNIDNAGWGDWRKRICFVARIPPLSYQRFDTSYRLLPPEKINRWKTPPLPNGKALVVETPHLTFQLNLRTGLVDSIAVGGRKIIQGSSFCPLLFEDVSHSWDTPAGWSAPLEQFRLARPVEAARVMGSDYSNSKLARGKRPITILEDGPVRLIIQTIFVARQSYIVQRYVINRRRPVVRVEQTIFWAEHDKLLRLGLFHHSHLRQLESDSLYSIDVQDEPYNSARVEKNFQHFLRFYRDDGPAFAIISHGGHSYRRKDNEVQLGVLRSPSYATMQVSDECDAYHNRYIPRQEQGLSAARWTLAFGKKASTSDAAARAAYEENIPLDPFVYFPTAAGRPIRLDTSFLKVDRPNVLVTAVKKSERGNDLVIRLWETANKATNYAVEIGTKRYRGKIGPAELQTFRLTRAGKLIPCDLLERPQQT